VQTRQCSDCQHDMIYDYTGEFPSNGARVFCRMSVRDLASFSMSLVMGLSASLWISPSHVNRLHHQHVFLSTTGHNSVILYVRRFDSDQHRIAHWKRAGCRHKSTARYGHLKYVTTDKLYYTITVLQLTELIKVWRSIRPTTTNSHTPDPIHVQRSPAGRCPVAAEQGDGY